MSDIYSDDDYAQFGTQLAAVGNVKLMGIYGGRTKKFLYVHIEHNDYTNKPMTPTDLVAFGHMCLEIGEAMKHGIVIKQ